LALPKGGYTSCLIKALRDYRPGVAFYQGRDPQ